MVTGRSLGYTRSRTVTGKRVRAGKYFNEILFRIKNVSFSSVFYSYCAYFCLTIRNRRDLEPWVIQLFLVTKIKWLNKPVIITRSNTLADYLYSEDFSPSIIIGQRPSICKQIAKTIIVLSSRHNNIMIRMIKKNRR